MVDNFGFACPILFDDMLEHSVFANLEPISAGFCEITFNEGLAVCAYGENISLDLKCRDMDSGIIERFLREEY
jgi:hypothetical protein